MATIKEDYCSQDVYRLLIEKGFEGEIHTTFDKEGYTQASITLQMAMKWLREVHKIHINILIRIILEQYSGYDAVVCKENEDGFLTKGSHLNNIKDGTNYKEACESAIKYCLENLI